MFKFAFILSVADASVSTVNDSVSELRSLSATADPCPGLTAGGQAKCVANAQCEFKNKTCSKKVVAGGATGCAKHNGKEKECTADKKCKWKNNKCESGAAAISTMMMLAALL